MQFCPKCRSVYDENTYSECPICAKGGYDFSRIQMLFFDKKKGRNRYVSKEEYEEDPDRYEDV